MEGVNFLAVVAAAASAFILGGIWYSAKVFGGVWMREMKDNRKMGGTHKAKVFGLSFLFSLVAANGFYILLGAHPSLDRAVTLALVIGGSFVATSFGINYQFANRSTRIWLIDAGYHLCQFLMYGLIFAFWPW